MALERNFDEGRISSLVEELREGFRFQYVVDKLHKAEILDESTVSEISYFVQQDICDKVTEIAAINGEIVPDDSAIILWLEENPTPTTELVAQIAQEVKEEIDRKWSQAC